MFNWLRRRRLSDDARRRLLLVAARSEEAIVETHVSNLLDLVDALGEEADLDRAFELYGEMIPIDETMADTVATRLMARLQKRGRKPKQTRYRRVFRESSR